MVHMTGNLKMLQVQTAVLFHPIIYKFDDEGAIKIQYFELRSDLWFT